MRSEGEHDGRNILSKYKERNSAEKPRRTSPEFSLPSHRKEIRKKHCLRRAYPCSGKVKHVRISSTSGSTKYTSINDWKIHNGSSDHFYLNPNSLLFFYQSIQVVLMMDPGWDSKHWQKIVLTVDSPMTNSEIINHRGLKSNITKYLILSYTT